MVNKFGSALLSSRHDNIRRAISSLPSDISTWFVGGQKKESRSCGSLSNVMSTAYRISDGARRVFGARVFRDALSIRSSSCECVGLGCLWLRQ